MCRPEDPCNSTMFTTLHWRLLVHTRGKAVWCSGLSTEQGLEGVDSLLLTLSLKCCDWASHFTSLVLSFFSCGMGILFNEHDFYMANTFIFSLNLRTVPCLYSRSSNTCLENERIKVGNKNVVYECSLLLIINSTTGCSRRLGLIVT